MIRFGPLVTDPWPHSVSMPMLPAGIFRRLGREYPGEEWFSGSVETGKLREHTDRREMRNQHPDWSKFLLGSPIWSEFYQFLGSVQFLEEIIALFRPHLDRYGFLGSEVTEYYRPDLYFFEGQPGMVLNRHLDCPDRLFSGVIYFDPPDGGEFLLFERGRPEAVRRIIPGANLGTVWLPTNDSFHAVLPSHSRRRTAYFSIRADHLLWNHTKEYL